MQKINNAQQLKDTPVANDSALKLLKNDAQSNAKETNRVLLIIWDGSPADNIEKLFRGRGYKTLRQYMSNVSSRYRLTVLSFTWQEHQMYWNRNYSILTCRQLWKSVRSLLLIGQMISIAASKYRKPLHTI